jgi:replicative DNA helicase
VTPAAPLATANTGELSEAAQAILRAHRDIEVCPISGCGAQMRITDDGEGLWVRGPCQHTRLEVAIALSRIAPAPTEASETSNASSGQQKPESPPPSKALDANDAVRAGIFNPKATEPIPGRRSVYGGEGPRRTTEEARAASDDLRVESLDALAPTLGQGLAGAFRMARRRATGEERPVPLPFPGLSELLGGGLWPGAYVLVGGTGIGKSALALQVGLHGARAGCPALYEGLELDTAQIIMRLASQALGEHEPRPVPWGSLYRGRDLDAIERAEKLCEAELAKLPFRVEEAPPGGWSASALFGRVRALKEAHPEATGTPVVVVDFLQLVGSEPGGRREELRERIGRAAYTGREAARKLGAVVLMLSSISREGARLISALAEQGELGHCDPADLVGLGKESGDIEFSADAVLTLAPEKWDPGDPSAPRPVHVAIGKQRAGPAAWGLLTFNGAWFSEAGRAVEVALEERQISARAGRAAKRDAAKAEKDAQDRAEALKQVLAKLAKGAKTLRALRASIGLRHSVVDAALEQAKDEGLVRPAPSGTKGWILASVPQCAPECPSVPLGHGDVCVVPRDYRDGARAHSPPRSLAHDSTGTGHAPSHDPVTGEVLI